MTFQDTHAAAAAVEATRITPAALLNLQSWEGRTEVQKDMASEAQVKGLAAVLNRPDLAGTETGSALPALWHWLYFLPRALQQELDSDGHPRRGGFLPAVPLPRRMWAGGRLHWHGRLRAGQEMQRTTKIVSVTHKSGRSGDLLFVLLRHEITSGGKLAVTEEQDIVYRAPALPGAPVPTPQPAPGDAAWARNIEPDPVLLFRYSALTFNGHRIHYDRPYATEVEGYPGLVVHGPLLATLLMDLANRENPGRRPMAFSFKAIRPVTDLHSFQVCGRPETDGKRAALWIEDHEGSLAMQAEIEFA